MSETKNPEQTVRIFYGRSDIRGLGPDVRLHPCGEKPLRPYNEIPLATWKAFENHPQIKGLIADGSIKVLSDTTAKPAEQADEGKGKRARKTEPPAAPPAASQAAPAKDAEKTEPPAPPADSEAAQALKSLGLA